MPRRLPTKPGQVVILSVAKDHSSAVRSPLATSCKFAHADRWSKTETETIERALDAILAEHKRNQLVAEANERFVASGITVKDVFGKLAK